MSYETVLQGLAVHAQGDQNVFATPMDYRDGMVFTVHVEPPDESGRDGVNLHTVVRKGTRQSNGTWLWVSTLIEPRTILDEWHTQASIAVDEEGYVHVAYNMHNLPWQYVISKRPYDISEFDFKGQAITQAEIERTKFENKTNFPDVGSAAIPGNQVTYPMFFKDRYGSLYVTYRFAVKPSRRFEQRAFGAGIAKYSIAEHKWTAIGGNASFAATDSKAASVQMPFAFQDGYTVYLPTLAFSQDNHMHVFWNWRPGVAGMETIRPSYATSPDGIAFFNAKGATVALPIKFDTSTPVTGVANEEQFYAAKSVAVSASGMPMVIMQPALGKGRQIWSLDKSAGRFIKEEAPAAATTLIVDKQGRQWAFASGLRVFMRASELSNWDEIGTIGINMCNPRIGYYPDESRFVVHAKSCTSGTVSIVTFRR